MKLPLLLGIDGGGTRCRARLTDSKGAWLAEAEGGSANVFSGFDAAINVMEALIADVIQQAGFSVAHLSETHIVAGLAGANVDSVAQRLKAWRPACASLRLLTDVETACLGAHGGQPGAVFIVGTGSQGACWDGSEFTLSGGWGFALSDLGSGAALGHRALRLALLAHEAIVAPSPLTHNIMAHYQHSAEAMLLWTQQATPADWARIVPEVFSAAQQGDVHGEALVKQTAQDIALMVQPLLQRQPGKLALMGGLAQPIKAWLPADIQDVLVMPQQDALTGALYLAQQHASNSL